MGYTWPVVAPVSQAFGSFPNNGVNPSGGHTGIDFATPAGTPVYAVADGVIEFADWQTGPYQNSPWWLVDGGGINVVLNCGDDKPTFTHGHLSSTHLNVDDRVRKGDLLGYTGNSGKWTTGPHLHFEALPPGFNLRSSTYGRINPAQYCSGNPGASLAANERRAGDSKVKRRAEPNTGSRVIELVEENTDEVFTGYVIGETVNGINVWFKDDVGYAWAGGFESQSTDGLPNLTPNPSAPAVAKNERVTGQYGVVRREGPNKNAAERDRFDPDRAITVNAYVRGEDPFGDGNNVWFVGGLSGGYMWSGGFTSQSVDGLTDATVAAPVDQVPAYTFTADFDFVEVIPADVSNVQVAAANPGVTVFPAMPDTAVCHWFGDPALGIQMTSPIAEFRRPTSFKSAHFVVGEDRIVQMVSLADRAYHAGAVGNNMVGIEIDPRGAGTDAVARRIQANVRRLLQALASRYGAVLQLTLHRDVPGNNTACSGLTLADFVSTSINPAGDITPAPQPTPQPPLPHPAPGEVEEFLAWLYRKYQEETKVTT